MRQNAQSAIKSVFIECYDQIGLEHLTVSKICAAAGVSRPTFYTYFEDLNQLKSSIEFELMQDMTEIVSEWEFFSLRQIDLSRPLPIYTKIVRYIAENAAIFKALFGPHGDSRFIFDFYEMNRKIYSSRITKDFPDFKYPELLTSYVMGSIPYINHDYIEARDKSIEEKALLITRATVSVLQLSEKM